MFEAGPEGFVGGLSADNYLAITKTSRATATSDLQDLVDKGALTRSGRFRFTRLPDTRYPQSGHICWRFLFCVEVRNIKHCAYCEFRIDISWIWDS
ncbi:hypothetical protein [Falsochrobactrum shanghaiense]|uniref:hypothetical protein n=1 Tax=Falsochrobactrum shanghaiense TaxID=2201899 RepID=UPI0018EEAAE8